jgi:hypothetical protein
MQAIRTRYHGPTNTRGARFSAKCEAGSIYMPYAHGLNTAGNHAAACKALVKKLGWDDDGYGHMVGGQFAGDTYWVFDDKRLSALKAFVNSYRAGTWSGNPWMKPEFRACVEAIGRSYDFYGSAYETPTTDDEAAKLATK